MFVIGAESLNICDLKSDSAYYWSYVIIYYYPM